MASETTPPLTARDWFGIGIRMFAVWTFFCAFQNFLYFIDVRAGWAVVSDGYSQMTPESCLLYVVGYGAFGLILLSNAAAVSQFAYPVVPSSEEDVPNSP